MSMPRAGGIAAPNWTDQEKDYLTANWGKLPQAELSAHLKRSKYAVEKKAKTMKLRGTGSPIQKKVAAPAAPADPGLSYDEKKAAWFASLSPDEAAYEGDWQAYVHWEPLDPKEHPYVPPQHVPHATKCQMALWKDNEPVPRPALYCGKPTQGRSFCPKCCKVVYTRSSYAPDHSPGVGVPYSTGSGESAAWIRPE